MVAMVLTPYAPTSREGVGTRSREGGGLGSEKGVEVGSQNGGGPWDALIQPIGSKNDQWLLLYGLPGVVQDKAVGRGWVRKRGLEDCQRLGEGEVQEGQACGKRSAASIQYLVTPCGRAQKYGKQHATRKKRACITQQVT